MLVSYRLLVWKRHSCILPLKQSHEVFIKSVKVAFHLCTSFRNPKVDSGRVEKLAIVQSPCSLIRKEIEIRIHIFFAQVRQDDRNDFRGERKKGPRQSSILLLYLEELFKVGYSSVKLLLLEVDYA